jgi:hypothetical protein
MIRVEVSLSPSLSKRNDLGWSSCSENSVELRAGIPCPCTIEIKVEIVLSVKTNFWKLSRLSFVLRHNYFLFLKLKLLNQDLAGSRNVSRGKVLPWLFLAYLPQISTIKVNILIEMCEKSSYFERERVRERERERKKVIIMFASFVPLLSFYFRRRKLDWKFENKNLKIENDFTIALAFIPLDSFGFHLQLLLWAHKGWTGTIWNGWGLRSCFWTCWWCSFSRGKPTKCWDRAEAAEVSWAAATTAAASGTRWEAL